MRSARTQCRSRPGPRAPDLEQSGFEFRSSLVHSSLERLLDLRQAARELQRARKKRKPGAGPATRQIDRRTDRWTDGQTDSKRVIISSQFEIQKTVLAVLDKLLEFKM